VLYILVEDKHNPRFEDSGVAIHDQFVRIFWQKPKLFENFVPVFPEKKVTTLIPRMPLIPVPTTTTTNAPWRRGPRLAAFLFLTGINAQLARDRRCDQGRSPSCAHLGYHALTNP
jgi:hypothetical protein